MKGARKSYLGMAQISHLPVRRLVHRQPRSEALGAPSGGSVCIHPLGCPGYAVRATQVLMCQRPSYLILLHPTSFTVTGGRRVCFQHGTRNFGTWNLNSPRQSIARPEGPVPHCPGFSRFFQHLKMFIFSPNGHPASSKPELHAFFHKFYPK